ncbi:MAG TPA: guanylate kinase [Gemmatimonadales bacterium]|nr:guanylate kinase [Gemmatimonadales bacterium]
MTPKVVVLSAPSGAGKTTIARALVARRGDVAYSVSATTRAPRPDERDGTAYYFLSRPEFERRVRAGEFLEWAEYAGELYGTLRSEVEGALRAGRHVVLDIEVEGARQVRRVYPPPRSVSVFVLPPSVPVLLDRLRRRRTEDRAALARRLERAVEELREAPRYDHVVVNDDLNRAVAEVEQIIDGRVPPGSGHAGLAARVQELAAELEREAARLRTDI